MKHRLSLIWPPLLIGALFLLAWQALVVIQDLKPYLLPAPSLIFTTFITNLNLMWATGLYTATTAVLGLIFGTVVGIVFAMVAQRFFVFRNLMIPVAAGIAAVPIVALTPILNNMFDITSRTPRVLITAIVVFFPIFVNVYRGLTEVAPVQMELLRSMSASPRTVLRVLRIPNALPFFFTGLKVAAPLAVIAALVAEYFGGPQEGLGSKIASSAANSAYGRAWAYVVVAIIVGLAFYLVTLMLERWTTPWASRTRSA
ncbi:MAG: ABC transporter permease [Candidatus Nanopelagicales bacterium]